MVYIHGGFLQFGSGHEDGLCPSGKLARETNMVYVSFNYRLYALGFLALEQLAAGDGNAVFGNYGLWDQMVVLEWIQENIRSFGGDPNKVTLFGSDAGAASILALMTNPDSRSLFSSAWLIDPALYFNITFAQHSQYNNNHFLQATQCQNASCLRALTPQMVTEHFLGSDDPSFRISDQNDLPIQGMFTRQLIAVDGK